MATNTVRYPAATAVVHALPCLQRTDMDAVGLVSRELYKEVEASSVRRCSFLRLRCDELSGWECACNAICQCEGAPATERISIKSAFVGLMEVFQHTLRYSSASISFVELDFGDVHVALSGIAAGSSVVALYFYAVDFSEYSADEFHRFVLSFGQLRTLKLDYRCTASHDYLTDSFLRKCVAKRLLDVAFESLPSGADRYDLTDKGILDFISLDADKDECTGRRSLDVIAAKVSQNFFKRLVEATTCEEALRRTKVAEFSILLRSMDSDEQDVDDYEDYAEFYDWARFLEFRFRELPSCVSFDIYQNTLYATNEPDSCRHRSDFPSNCISSIFVVLLVVYILLGL